MWPLLNSAGRCSATCDQTGVAGAGPSAVRRSAWYASCSASDVGRVPPDHAVGVGPEPCDVVPARGSPDVLVGGRARRQPSGSAASSAVRVDRAASSALKTDHMV